MTKIYDNVPQTVFSRYCAGLLGVGLLFIVFAVSASVKLVPEVAKARESVSLPRNYCLGNVASLGTGLVQAPVRLGQEFKQDGGPWTGWLRASASGRYELSVPDDGGRIFLNRQQIFARSGASKPAAVQVELLANRFYAITVESPDSTDSILPLQWRRPDGRREAVPKAYLYAPVATVGANEVSVTKQ